MRRGGPERPTFLRLLLGILLTYGLIIGFGDTGLGDPGRVILLGVMFLLALQLRRVRGLRWWVAAGVALLTTAAGLARDLGSPQVASSVVGACTFILIIGLVSAIVATVVRIGTIDTAAVLGVLCVYLLLALFFASLNQMVGAWITHYLNGAGDPPSSSDLLYLSVITLTTVGYGDITPLAGFARAVSGLEALTGQLYLVSVVAAVIGGWQRPIRERPEPPESGE